MDNATEPPSPRSSMTAPTTRQDLPPSRARRRPRRPRRGRPRSPRRPPALLLAALLARGSRGAPPDLSPPSRQLMSCAPDQHAFVLTIYTDLHSIDDNAFQLSHASYGVGQETGNSGTYIDSERLAPAHAAVLQHTVCADGSAAVPHFDHAVDPDAGSIAPSNSGGDLGVESCYDLELRDINGDGLTAPHSGHGGSAGGVTLALDGRLVLSHHPQSCLSADPDEWQACARDHGFAYCGVRVCTGGDGGDVVTGLSSLSGSQCSFTQPQCAIGSVARTSSSSVRVAARTDAFAVETSWEVRRSTPADLQDAASAAGLPLLLAGGGPAYLGDDVLLGRAGVGVPLEDNESYEAIACLDDEGAGDACFDFRAHDTYGDGMGCGADGALELILETLGEDGEVNRVTLAQRDRDMARVQMVDGSKQLACLDEDRLKKWSRCAVRVCANGDVVALEGNQCDFGLGDELLNRTGEEPVVDLEITPKKAEAEEEEEEKKDVVVIKPQKWEEEEDDMEPVIIVPPIPQKASANDEDKDVVVIKPQKRDEEEPVMIIPQKKDVVTIVPQKKEDKEAVTIVPQKAKQTDDTDEEEDDADKGILNVNVDLNVVWKGSGDDEDVAVELHKAEAEVELEPHPDWELNVNDLQLNVIHDKKDEEDLEEGEEEEDAVPVVELELPPTKEWELVNDLGLTVVHHKEEEEELQLNAADLEEEDEEDEGRHEEPIVPLEPPNVDINLQVNIIMANEDKEKEEKEKKEKEEKEKNKKEKAKKEKKKEKEKKEKEKKEKEEKEKKEKEKEEKEEKEKEEAAMTLQLNTVNAEEEQATWAEYYEALQPGLRVEDGSTTTSSSSDGPATMSSSSIALKPWGGDGFVPVAPKRDRRPPQDRSPNEQRGHDKRSTKEQELKLRPFSATLLAVDYPQRLRHGQRRQDWADMSRDIGDYLLAHPAWRTTDVPAPTEFELDCALSPEEVGPETRWVVRCEGTARFRPAASPPSRREMHAVVASALRGSGKARAAFLEVMYGAGASRQQQLQQRHEKLEDQRRPPLRKRVPSPPAGGKTSRRERQKREKREKAKRDKAKREKAKREKDKREKEKREDEKREKEKRDKEKRDKEEREKEKRDKEKSDKRDKEKRNKEKRDKERRDKEKRDKEKRDKEKRDKEKQEKRDKKQEQMRPSQGTVDLANLLDRDDGNSKKNQKEKEKQEKQEQKDRKKLDKQQQRGELNVMGYVSGAQNMNPMSAADKGYKFVDGDSRQGGVHVYVDDDERRGRRHLRRPRPYGERR